MIHSDGMDARRAARFAAPISSHFAGIMIYLQIHYKLLAVYGDDIVLFIAELVPTKWRKGYAQSANLTPMSLLLGLRILLMARKLRIICGPYTEIHLQIFRQTDRWRFTHTATMSCRE
jgi:hypothetical protein